jgi:hypothetical protein
LIAAVSSSTSCSRQLAAAIDNPEVAGLLALMLLHHAAVAGYLHERDGDLATAARLYAKAAQKALNLAERDYLTRQAARLNARRRR